MGTCKAQFMAKNLLPWILLCSLPLLSACGFVGKTERKIGLGIGGGGGSISQPPEKTRAHNPMTSREPERRHYCMTDDIGWRSESLSDKKKTMQDIVLPEMRKLFKDFDEARYSRKGELHCQTCHGESKTEGEFDFSKPSSLYPLDPYNLPTVNDPDPQKAKMVRFMTEKVVPTMNRLLRGANVTCFSCHAVKK